MTDNQMTIRQDFANRELEEEDERIAVNAHTGCCFDAYRFYGAVDRYQIQKRSIFVVRLDGNTFF